MPFLQIVGCLIVIGTLERGGLVKGSINEQVLDYMSKRQTPIDNLQHSVTLNDVSVFTADKREITIDVHFEYTVRRGELSLLISKYGNNYEAVLNRSAIDTLKGTCPHLSTRDFFQNSQDQHVEHSLHLAVRERLGGRCCAGDCGAFTLACPPGCEEISSCSATMKGLHADVTSFTLVKVKIPDFVLRRIFAIMTENDCDDAEDMPDKKRRFTGAVPICDLVSHYRWYKADDNIDMPTTAPQIGACGTQYPIWVNGTIPLNDTAEHDLDGCMVLKEGFTCALHLTINGKNCGNYQLYWFTPVSYCPMGYCLQEPEHGDDEENGDGEKVEDGGDDDGAESMHCHWAYISILFLASVIAVRL